MYPRSRRQRRRNLVDALRDQARRLVSLISEDDSAVVGHSMFFPVSLASHPTLKIMGLAPMAVAPKHRRKGREGFGFSSSTRYGIGCEYDVPEEVFMVVELRDGFLRGASGKVKYHAA